ncbi:hypothetical protein [Paenibacillus marinisediminis]
MSAKKPVQFHPYNKTRHRVQKLKVCKHCHTYTVLPAKQCTNCGKKQIISVEQRSAILARRSLQSHLLLVALISLVAVLFSNTFLQMALSLAAGVVCILAMWYFQRKAIPYETTRELDKLIKRDESNIVKGVFRDWESAIGLWKTEPVKSYEMLREISTVQRSSTIRLQQIALLDSFILRKDMDLQLEPLLVSHFEPMLARYIGELARVKRDLIKERALRYVTTYEIEIYEMEQGTEILTAVVGAAVRMKHYVQLYPNFIARYARYLPKDRFLRLYNIIAQNSAQDWGGLRDEVYQIYKEQYQWDPDFQSQ